jgi:hypothetical protein
MVLGFQALISEGSSAYYALETVHITDDGPRLLSTMSHASQ